MTTTSSTAASKYSYQYGFGNHFATEALPDALPKTQNSPQQCNYGLYAEQLNGTAFTAPRAKNQRSWLYRIRPSVGHSRFAPYRHPSINSSMEGFVSDPSQYRWDPVTLLPTVAADSAEGEVPRIDFVDGLVQICGAGDAAAKDGLIIYNYRANVNMDKRVMMNSDGSFLIVPQTGCLDIRTEFGMLHVSPCEIVVIPRGIKFTVNLDSDNTESARGYVLEILKGNFEIPGLGPIGANGLANPRDFEIPVACFQDVDEDHVLLNKYLSTFHVCVQNHSPFDIVAWHGNYYPYKYDLRKFNTMNSVSFDHPDPSIYTVLTCQSDEAGTAVADFVIFPPRWMVMEHSFRPPYYHRNVMTEYMGMIYGKYDAKKGGPGGFVPGGGSLHSCMTSHGPDETVFLAASTVDPLVPQYFDGGLAFMFETVLTMRLNPQALLPSSSTSLEMAPVPEVEVVGQEGFGFPRIQQHYTDCWKHLPKIFDGTLHPAFPSPSAAK